MSRTPALFAVAAFLLAAPQARALTLTLDHVSGTWSHVLGAPATFLTDGDEAQIRWGGDGGFGQSGLGFRGNAALPLALIPAQDFELGTLRHFNNPVMPPTVTSANLAVDLTLHELPGAPTFTFTIRIDETPNSPPCPYESNIPCSDKISFPNSFAPETFTYAGRLIALEIEGFRLTPGGPVVTEFISDERQTNGAVLVARLHVLKGGCAFTLGYWKNHPTAWPVSQLPLGDRLYTKAELLKIFGTPVRGNGLVSLAHQLIAAKLNRAAFAASPDTIENAFFNADTLIGPRVVPSIGTGQLSPSVVSPLVTALDRYNNGFAGPPHCK